jgi:hypothetical protein
MIPAPAASANVAAPATASFSLPALVLVAASLLTLVLLARHPVADIGAAHGPVAVLSALAQLRVASAWMHGLLVCVLAALLYGVIALATTLELRRPAVAFGLAAHGFGIAAMIGAMLVDGFMTAPLAQRLLDVHQFSGGTAAFALVEFAVQILSKTGFCAMALGMTCLSWARFKTTRLLAALSIAAGALPAGALLASGVQLAPHALGLMAGMQALWYWAAAYYLWRSSDSIARA